MMPPIANYGDDGRCMETQVSPSAATAKRALDEIKVGERVVFSRTFTEADVTLFVGLTWDVNPIHSDAEFAKKSRIGKRVVPGLLTGSLITHIGGLWAMLANRMSFDFSAPVFVGDTITAEVTVTETNGKGWAKLSMRCINQDGAEVLRGEVSGWPHRHWVSEQ